MIKWKRLLCLGMAASMMLSITAYGDVIDFTGPEGQVSAAESPGTSTPSAPSGSDSSQNPASSVAVEKPTVQSEGAVLLNANTGEILFEKNGNTRFLWKKRKSRRTIKIL